MTKKAPKTKHKPFASFSVRLQDNDWMIGVFNPNDRMAMYFLAEPIAPRNNQPKGANMSRPSPSGVQVSALNRQGLSECTITGLPRKFKTVEDAMEWLEGQVEEYEGDKAFPIGEGIDTVEELHVFSIPALPIDKEHDVLVDKLVTEKISGKKKKLESKADIAKHAKETKGKNGTKSAKTAHSDGPYVKPASKFKTSKEELKSLGLDGLFDEP